MKRYPIIDEAGYEAKLKAEAKAQFDHAEEHGIEQTFELLDAMTQYRDSVDAEDEL